MLIIDIASGDVLEEVPAHSKELWSVTLLPDKVISMTTKNAQCPLISSFISPHYISFRIFIVR